MLQICKKTKEDTARLKCYDAIFDAMEAAKKTPETPAPVTKQDWQIEESKSPIDDSPQVTAMLPSTDGAGLLVLRCKEHSTEAAIAPKGLYASKTGDILLRLNDQEAVTATWTASDNNQALFAPNGRAFVTMLPDGGTLFARATGWRGQRALDATFSLGTVSVAREKIKEACKWTDGANSAIQPAAPTISAPKNSKAKSPAPLTPR